MANLLDYENQLLLDNINEDRLVITARGLQVAELVTNLIKVYCSPQNLVIVIGASQSDESYFIDQLDKEGAKPLPKIINSESAPNDRKDIYLEGGVLFVTPRILVVDLLVNRIPIDLITGFIVYRAHKVIESGHEGFCLRMFREKNKKGFIKAFSSNPESFTTGFAQIEKVMKNLFIGKLDLWPRFRAEVQTALEKSKPEVFEIRVPITPLMRTVQTALLDIISICLKELKKLNSSLDSDDLTVETAMTKSFDHVVRFRLEPEWHTLSLKTKHLVNDLKTLRTLLGRVTEFDCVTFYHQLSLLRNEEKAVQNSMWLMMDSADSLFVSAKRRMYGGEKKGPASGEEVNLEVNPKWEALLEVLEECKEQCQEGFEQQEGPILVVTRDDSTSLQIKECICKGAKTMLIKLYNKFISEDTGEKPISTVNKQKNGGKNKSSNEGEDSSKNDSEVLDENDMMPRVLVSSELDEEVRPLNGPVVLIHPIKDYSNPYALVNTLYEIQPTHVIMYDCDLTFVRHLEVYKARNMTRTLKVYVLFYSESAEEQKYLSSIRREKVAFESLIRAKASMVIPTDIEGRGEDTNLLLVRDLGVKASEQAFTGTGSENTRKGGNTTQVVEQRVAVDLREFRSELPSILHRRGITIVPVTLEIGDYVLTPDICVERKSISDLVQSLNKGRLYTQAQAMCRHYAKPILLIEFDTSKSFYLQSGNEGQTDTMAKLQLLTLHFPQLKIFWCASPYATAELFHKIKENRAQPDIELSSKLVTPGSEIGGQISKFNAEPFDFVSHLPGISSKNVYPIVNKLESVRELCRIGKEKLCEVLGNETVGGLLFDSLHDRASELRSSGSLENKPSRPKKRARPSEDDKKKIL